MGEKFSLSIDLADFKLMMEDFGDNLIQADMFVTFVLRKILGDERVVFEAGCIRAGGNIYPSPGWLAWLDMRIRNKAADKKRRTLTGYEAASLIP